MRHWYISAPHARGFNDVITNEGMIIQQASPYWRDFHGRPLRDLILHLEEGGEVFFEEFHT